MEEKKVDTRTKREETTVEVGVLNETQRLTSGFTYLASSWPSRVYETPQDVDFFAFFFISDAPTSEGLIEQLGVKSVRSFVACDSSGIS